MIKRAFTICGLVDISGARKKSLVIVDTIESSEYLTTGAIKVGKRRWPINFKSTIALSDATAESLLLLALPAAMRRGEPLRIEAQVSSKLLEQLPKIQDIYHCWEPTLRQVEVIATARPTVSTLIQSPQSTQPKTAIAFTGGVDSFYSAIRSPDAALVYVHGLDVPLGNHNLRKQVSNKLNWAASELGRPLLEMETNLREFSDRYLDWHLAIGGALAACALLLSRHVSAFGIPAGQSYASLLPDGAHPVLNPLFGTEKVTFETIGCEARRIDKIAAIAPSPTAQRALRVCWENRGDAYNCGVCEKCLRTMTALEIFGAMHQFTTFEVPLNYERLSRTVAKYPELDIFTRENLAAARSQGASPTLIRSLERSLDRGEKRLPRRLASLMPRLLADWRYRLFHR